MVQTELRGLTNIGAGNVAVSGTNPNFTVDFISALEHRNVLELRADDTFDTGSVTTATVQDGSGGGWVAVVEVYTANDTGDLPSGLADTTLARTSDGQWWKKNPETGVSPQQTVEIIGATSGDFTLTFEGQETDSLEWDIDSSTLLTELEALSTIPVSSIAVLGSNPFAIVFGGAFQDTSVSPLIPDVGNLLPQTATVNVETTLDAVWEAFGSANNIQTVLSLPGIPTTFARQVFWTSEGGGSGDDQIWATGPNNSLWYPTMKFSVKSGTPGS